MKANTEPYDSFGISPPMSGPKKHSAGEIFYLVDSKYFCYLELHKKFQNPS